MTRESPEDRRQRERTGVDGDPVPDRDYGDTDKGDRPVPDGVSRHQDADVSPSVRAAAERLAAAGDLTERQALAFVLRDVEGVPRPDAADRMGVSTSTLDTLVSKGRRKVAEARQVVDVVAELQ